MARLERQRGVKMPACGAEVTACVLLFPEQEMIERGGCRDLVRRQPLAVRGPGVAGRRENFGAAQMVGLCGRVQLRCLFEEPETFVRPVDHPGQSE